MVSIRIKKYIVVIMGLFYINNSNLINFFFFTKFKILVFIDSLTFWQLKLWLPT